MYFPPFSYPHTWNAPQNKWKFQIVLGQAHPSLPKIWYKAVNSWLVWIVLLFYHETVTLQQFKYAFSLSWFSNFSFVLQNYIGWGKGIESLPSGIKDCINFLLLICYKPIIHCGFVWKIMAVISQFVFLFFIIDAVFVIFLYMTSSVCV